MYVGAQPEFFGLCCVCRYELYLACTFSDVVAYLHLLLFAKGIPRDCKFCQSKIEQPMQGLANGGL